MTALGSRATSILLAALVGGCQIDDGGFGRTTGQPTGSSGAPATEGDGTASTDRGTDASSGDAAGSTSTGASGSGTADGSTGSSTGVPSEGSGTEGETGGPSPAEGQPYGPCVPGGTCMGPGVVCYESPRGRDMCIPPCDGTNPSCPPAPPDNESLVECVNVPGTPHCMLNCAAGGQGSCPAGTVCEEVFDGIFRCLWP